MKTEKEVKKQLKLAQNNLRNSRKQFEKYDNIDDMDAITIYEEEVRVLEWVLKS